VEPVFKAAGNECKAILFFVDGNLNQARDVAMLESIVTICSRVQPAVMFLIRPKLIAEWQDPDQECGIVEQLD
jgi:hypothetical protein